ncbi:UNVERIFIED_CONTAM: HNH endonuclease [Microbacterium sp. SLM126]
MPLSNTRRARAGRRRARRVAAADNDLTLDEWESIVEAWGACAYCGAVAGPFQKDCVLPISRGGRYTVGNVVPACRSCNASKSNDEVTSWLRRKRLDERAFLLRHVEILGAWRSTGGLV